MSHTGRVNEAQLGGEKCVGGVAAASGLHYHVSARRNRESILRHGLVPGFDMCDPGTAQPHPMWQSWPRYVWLFPRREDALWALGGSWGSSAGDNDLWIVDCTGLPLIPDPHPGWPDRLSVATTASIPTSRIRKENL